MIDSLKSVDSSDNVPCRNHTDMRSQPYNLTRHIPGRILAGLLLVATFPLMLVLIVLIRCTSKGPAIYKQTRVGLGGKHFTVCKLRTMRLDAELHSGPKWATENDPRVTRIGAILRKLHLDELPQLWNVLVGEMALVGPRPERPEFTVRLAQEIPGYMQRVKVLPGITGLAQLNLPPDTDTASVVRKLVLDLEYVRVANWWLDTRIVICTALRALGIRKTFFLRALGVYRQVNEAGERPKVVSAPSSKRQRRKSALAE